MPARAAIVDLRKILAEKFPSGAAVPSSCLQTGLAFFDDAIEGGLPKSAITELISPQMSAGSATLIATLVSMAHRHQQFVALVDGADSFDPEGLDNAQLKSLFWVRCHKSLEAVKAADLLLRDGNFPLVIVDLVLNRCEEIRKIPQTSWYRLQRLAEASTAACLVLTRQSTIASAQLKIVLDNSWSLDALERENALLQMHVRVQRSHRRSTMEPRAS